VKKKTRDKIKCRIHHKLNPLHFYCRIRKILNKHDAGKVTYAYEHTLWKLVTLIMARALAEKEDE
jgi:hypothetical protein